MSRTVSERAPALRSAMERGEVPASGLAPGAGGGVRMNPRTSLSQRVSRVVLAALALVSLLWALALAGYLATLAEAGR